MSEDATWTEHPFSHTQRILAKILAMLREMTSNSKDYSAKAPSDLFKSWSQCCSCDNHRDGKELGVNVEKKNLSFRAQNTFKSTER